MVGYPGTTLGALFGDVEDQIFSIPEEAWALSRVPILRVELVLDIYLSITYRWYIVHKHIFCSSQVIGIIQNCGFIWGASYQVWIQYICQTSPYSVFIKVARFFVHRESLRFEFLFAPETFWHEVNQEKIKSRQKTGSRATCTCWDMHSVERMVQSHREFISFLTKFRSMWDHVPKMRPIIHVTLELPFFLTTMSSTQSSGMVAVLVERMQTRAETNDRWVSWPCNY